MNFLTASILVVLWTFGALFVAMQLLMHVWTGLLLAAGSTGESGWGAAFEPIGLVVPILLLGSSAYSIPLALALFGLAWAIRRKPQLDASWPRTAAGCALIGLLCYLPFVRSGGTEWPVPILAAFSLFAVRVLVPGFGPGAFSDPGAAARRLPRVFGVLAGIAVVAALAVAATYPVRSVLMLDCVPPASDSCLEPVECRGLPSPFVRRGVVSWSVFVSDVLFVAFPIALVVRAIAGLRGVRRRPGPGAVPVRKRARSGLR